jgi:hypothetical protein
VAAAGPAAARSGREPIFGGQNSIGRPCQKAHTTKIAIKARIAPPA